MNHVHRTAAVLAVGLAVLTAPLSAQVAQEKVDLDVVNKIREEGLQRSQIPALAGYLTDVNGPRLTGSPGMKRANDWTAQKLTEWGLSNVVVEPWGDFGRGWERVSYSGRVVTPYVQALQAIPTAWTGSTKGTVTGTAVVVRAETAADLAGYAGKLKGAIVMMQPEPDIEEMWEAPAQRTSLDELLGPPPERTGAAPDPAQREQMMARFRAMREVRDSADAMFRREGVTAILVPSSRAYGILRGGGSTAGRDPKLPEPLPELVVSQEQYAQLYRNVERGVPVQIELNVTNKFFSDDLKAYNTLADLPGTDKADEYVMLGAHLDSWHLGTGAMDNAAGSAVMMEAMRILKTLGLQPRRTVRIGLWSGEEQGLLGSRNWVENHPELHAKISAYVNVDNGTGKLRGIWDQSNDAVIPVFEQILWPFRDLGVVAVKHGNTGGTDHLAFDAAGIPGFNFIQDPIAYSSQSHHTFLDVYDHLQIDDLKQAAVVVAATVYHLAVREAMMPRKAGVPATN
ncbi:MAG: M20/M25/M40 family metallo-hydrolase [Gemmatimonadota bacterium]|nr:M20/M25/M40 family metallo-hydrolase [Gemmatimonadota bacterium]MDH5197136.1 M20/M25/M40 family metallo-hydrolase [Gemmatimonadota bacterium]